jgi:hypothetical protein
VRVITASLIASFGCDRSDTPKIEEHVAKKDEMVVVEEKDEGARASKRQFSAARAAIKKVSVDAELVAFSRAAHSSPGITQSSAAGLERLLGQPVRWRRGAGSSFYGSAGAYLVEVHDNSLSVSLSSRARSTRSRAIPIAETREMLAAKASEVMAALGLGEGFKFAWESDDTASIEEGSTRAELVSVGLKISDVRVAGLMPFVFDLQVAATPSGRLESIRADWPHIDEWRTDGIDAIATIEKDELACRAAYLTRLRRGEAAIESAGLVWDVSQKDHRARLSLYLSGLSRAPDGTVIKGWADHWPLAEVESLTTAKCDTQ